MGLLNLNDALIDPKRVSYIGNPDTKIKSHLNITLHFFLVIIDGHPVDIETRNKTDLLKLREKLIDQVNKVEGYLPG